MISPPPVASRSAVDVERIGSSGAAAGRSARARSPRAGWGTETDRTTVLAHRQRHRAWFRFNIILSATADKISSSLKARCVSEWVGTTSRAPTGDGGARSRVRPRGAT